MLCLESANLEPSDLIAIGAALVSGLSALYARWAWREAKRANEISLLSSRKAIFDAFFELKMHMALNGKRASLENVSRFYYPSRDATVYFEDGLAKKISDYYDSCFKVADLSRVQHPLLKTEQEMVTESLEKARTLAPEIEKAISKTLGHSIKNG